MSINLKTSPLLNSRLIAILFLGFSSGLPLALTGATLQAWFTEAHIDIVAIGALSLVGIPYTFKFLWAPIMDHYRLVALGGRRAWIILTQVMLAILLLLLANMQPGTQASFMAILAFIITFFSASQDIAVDAYRIDVLPENERGLGASYYVFAYRVAMLVSGGVALIFADHWGWKFTYEIMAVITALAIIPAYLAPPSLEVPTKSANVLKTIGASFRDLLKRDRIVLLLLFVIFYKLGDATAVSLMMTFLLKGIGFTLSEVGFAYKTVSFIAIVLGGFVGGAFLLRWHIYRALLVFGLAQTFSNLLFVVMAMAPKSFALMAFSVFVENFCSGLSTAAFVAFIMSLCNHEFSAGQYALLSAVAFIGRTFMGPVAGVMVAHFGWVQFYLDAFLLCFPGIFFLMLLKEKVLTHALVPAN